MSCVQRLRELDVNIKLALFMLSAPRCSQRLGWRNAKWQSPSETEISEGYHRYKSDIEIMSNNAKTVDVRIHGIAESISLTTRLYPNQVPLRSDE